MPELERARRPKAMIWAWEAEDPYRVLGVRRDATTDEIHDAYRRLARRLHPDVGGADVIEMVRIDDAWVVLRDLSTRAAYDATRAATDASPPVWNEEDLE